MPATMQPATNDALKARIAKLEAVIRQLLDVPVIRYSGVVTERLDKK